MIPLLKDTSGENMMGISARLRVCEWSGGQEYNTKVQKSGWVLSSMLLRTLEL